ncbi:MAG: hypothetical protein J0L83_14610 [Chitinophagales bacterium]|nr:hypothetical protein [Chitinophagales bacterium]
MEFEQLEVREKYVLMSEVDHTIRTKEGYYGKLSRISLAQADAMFERNNQFVKLRPASLPLPTENEEA